MTVGQRSTPYSLAFFKRVEMSDKDEFVDEVVVLLVPLASFSSKRRN